MKHTLFTLSILMLSCLQANEALASALPSYDDAEQMGFDADSKVDDSDLSGMRGGLQIGGLHFDFVITSQTLVDGVLQKAAVLQTLGDRISSRVVTINTNSSGNIVIEEVSQDASGATSVSNVVNAPNAAAAPDANNASSTTNNNASPQTIQEILPVLNNIVQSGTGNNVNTVANTNALYTVIQNSNDNAVIQQFNQLDLTVSNFTATQNSANVMQQMNFGAINSLK